jgi:hypothetical protein
MENRIPVYRNDKHVGFYPIEEHGAWPKRCNGTNLDKGDIVQIGKGMYEVVTVTVLRIDTVTAQPPIGVTEPGIPLEKY